MFTQRDCAKETVKGVRKVADEMERLTGILDTVPQDCKIRRDVIDQIRQQYMLLCQQSNDYAKTFNRER
ncbi:hypothetical protein [Azotosporobacter soli]|uniref:hypothetical protein n=1 Tax=Azotosporobacter soli TaxID=3055040 RepID=UPI0031FEEB04